MIDLYFNTMKYKYFMYTVCPNKRYTIDRSTVSNVIRHTVKYNLLFIILE